MRRELLAVALAIASLGPFGTASAVGAENRSSGDRVAVLRPSSIGVVQPNSIEVRDLPRLPAPQPNRILTATIHPRGLSIAPSIRARSAPVSVMPASTPALVNRASFAAATVAQDIQIGTTIAGLNASEAGTSTQWFDPPDVQLAIGPSAVLEMVNRAGRIWTKTGTISSTFSLDGFFLAGTDDLSDPRVLYDAISGRWLASVMDVSSLSVKLSISQSSDPGGSWSVYSFPSTFGSSTCPDQPKLGVSDQAVAITVNAFTASACLGDTDGSPVGAGLWVLNKSQLLSGNSVDYNLFGPDARYGGIQPAQSLSSSATLYLVSADHPSSSVAHMFSVSGAPTSGMTIPIVDIPIDQLSAPPAASQQGTSAMIDTGDNRIQDAVLQNGVLSFAANEACTPQGDTSVRSCVRIVRISTSTSTVLNWSRVVFTGGYIFYPALRPDSKGNLDVVFGASSSSAYPSLGVSSFLSGGTWSNSILKLADSTGAVTDGRYGDYFAAAVDPSDPDRIWVAGEIGTPSPDGSDWGTAIGSMKYSAPGPGPTASALAFGSQPIGGPASVPFTGQPAVRVVDGSGNTVTSGPGSTTPVTIAIGSNPGGGVITCTGGLTISAAAGIAAFQGCAISAPGAGYTLVASSPGLSSVTSAPFNVGGSQPLSLRFATQPGGAVPSVAFTIQPVIQVLDGGGNVVTSGPASATAVTLALGANPGGAAFGCAGGLTVAAVAGVATFSGCQLSAPGTGYTIIATSASANPATSAPFQVGTASGGPPAPALALAPSTVVIGWGEAVTFSVRLAPASGGGTVAGRGVQLEVSRDRVTWAAAAIQTTDATGDASFSYRPSDNRYYRATFAGAPDLGAAVSNVERVVTRQIAILRPTNSGSVKRVTRGTRITFTTMVRPTRPDLPKGHVTYEVWKKDGRVWIFVVTQTFAVDAAGKASLAVTFSKVGSYYVRSLATPTTFNANSAWSPAERYDVR